LIIRITTRHENPSSSQAIRQKFQNRTIGRIRLGMHSTSATGKKLFDKIQDMVMARMFTAMVPQLFAELNRRIQADIARQGEWVDIQSRREEE
jgi:hypothetical protein